MTQKTSGTRSFSLLKANVVVVNTNGGSACSGRVLLFHKILLPQFKPRLTSKLPVQKCVDSFIFQSTKKLPEHILIKFGMNSVTRSRYIKFLGVLMDEHLSWKFRISELTKKLSRMYGIFSEIRHVLPLYLLKNLYFPFSLPF